MLPIANKVNRKVLTQNKEDLKRLGVEALILFGSQAQGIASQSSDYDVGVLVKDNRILQSPRQRSELYDTLYNILSNIIQQLINIDVVFLDDAPAELQMHVVKHGVPIYEESGYAFLRFKERVMLSYADFAPYRETFHKSILSRIP